MKRPLCAAALIGVMLLPAPGEAAARKAKKDADRTVGATVVHRSASAAPHAVYVNGEYVGSDPDPNIRAYMARNPHIWDGPD